MLRWKENHFFLKKIFEKLHFNDSRNLIDPIGDREVLGSK